MSDSKIFKTHDGEWDYGGRIGEELELWLRRLNLDTVNNEYVVIVKVGEL